MWGPYTSRGQKIENWGAVGRAGRAVGRGRVESNRNPVKLCSASRRKNDQKVLLIGNGDVNDLDDAKIKITESGCDGIMFGRAMFGNPWVFSGIDGLRKSIIGAGLTKSEHGLDEKLEALVELAHGFEKLTPKKNF